MKKTILLSTAFIAIACSANAYTPMTNGEKIKANWEAGAEQKSWDSWMDRQDSQPAAETSKKMKHKKSVAKKKAAAAPKKAAKK